jgi:hypothetical protein
MGEGWEDLGELSERGGNLDESWEEISLWQERGPRGMKEGT